MAYSVWDAVSISIIALYAYPWFRFVSINDKRYAAMGIGMLLSEGSTKIIKMATAGLGPQFVRPAGAKDCNLLCNDGDSAGKRGLPSGHVSAAAYFFTYMALMAKTQQERTVWLVAGVALTSVYGFARMKKKCHNILQVVTGAIHGVVFAFVWHILSSRYLVNEQHQHATVATTVAL